MRKKESARERASVCVSEGGEFNARFFVCMCAHVCTCICTCVCACVHILCVCVCVFAWVHVCVDGEQQRQPGHTEGVHLRHDEQGYRK